MRFLSIATLVASFLRFSLISAHSEELRDMIVANSDFDIEKLRRDKEFFVKLNASQDPKVMWIGCSDSRAVPEILTQSNLGEIFSLRNIAGCVNKDDSTVKSAIQYAVQNLKIEDIVVVGHTNCGGIHAALNYDGLTGDLVPYIKPIYDTYLEHKSEIDELEDLEAKNAALSVLNVKRNVDTINDLDLYKKAIQDGKQINVHGFLFELDTGILKNLHLNRTNF